MILTQKQIQQDIEYYKKQAELSACLKKLNHNKDFMLVFNKYYCCDYVLTLVSQLNLHTEDSNEHKEILRELSAISYFQKFMDNIISNGAMALTSLNELYAIPESEINND